MNNAHFQIKRIYEDPTQSDGYRVLVDRLWPRGISKETARLDEWNKEIAPSTELRKWFDHRSERFAEFAVRYKEELKTQQDDLVRLRELASKKTITLVYAAKDSKHNHAAVLIKILDEK